MILICKSNSPLVLSLKATSQPHTELYAVGHTGYNQVYFTSRKGKLEKGVWAELEDGPKVS